MKIIGGFFMEREIEKNQIMIFLVRVEGLEPPQNLRP